MSTFVWLLLPLCISNSIVISTNGAMLLFLLYNSELTMNEFKCILESGAQSYKRLTTNNELDHTLNLSPTVNSQQLLYPKRQK